MAEKSKYTGKPFVLKDGAVADLPSYAVFTHTKPIGKYVEDIVNTREISEQGAFMALKNIACESKGSPDYDKNIYGNNGNALPHDAGTIYTTHVMNMGISVNDMMKDADALFYVANNLGMTADKMTYIGLPMDNGGQHFVHVADVPKMLEKTDTDISYVGNQITINTYTPNIEKSMGYDIRITDDTFIDTDIMWTVSEVATRKQYEIYPVAGYIKDIVLANENGEFTNLVPITKYAEYIVADKNSIIDGAVPDVYAYSNVGDAVEHILQGSPEWVLSHVDLDTIPLSEVTRILEKHLAVPAQPYDISDSDAKQLLQSVCAIKRITDVGNVPQTISKILSTDTQPYTASVMDAHRIIDAIGEVSGFAKIKAEIRQHPTSIDTISPDDMHTIKDTINTTWATPAHTPHIPDTLSHDVLSIVSATNATDASRIASDMENMFVDLIDREKSGQFDHLADNQRRYTAVDNIIHDTFAIKVHNSYTLKDYVDHNMIVDVRFEVESTRPYIYDKSNVVAEFAQNIYASNLQSNMTVQPHLFGQRDSRENWSVDTVYENMVSSMERLYKDTENTVGEDRIQQGMHNIVHEMDKVGKFLNARIKDISKSLENVGQDTGDKQSLQQVAEGLANEMKNLTDQKMLVDNLTRKLAVAYEHYIGEPWQPISYGKVQPTVLTGTQWQAQQIAADREFAKIPQDVHNVIVLASSLKATLDELGKLAPYLDQMKQAYPDMTLVTYGGKDIAEKIATNWAMTNRVDIVKYGLTFVSGQKNYYQHRNKDIIKNAELVRNVVICGETNTTVHLKDLAKQAHISTVSLSDMDIEQRTVQFSNSFMDKIDIHTKIPVQHISKIFTDTMQQFHQDIQGTVGADKSSKVLWAMVNGLHQIDHTLHKHIMDLDKRINKVEQGTNTMPKQDFDTLEAHFATLGARRSEMGDIISNLKPVFEQLEGKEWHPKHNMVTNIDPQDKIVLATVYKKDEAAIWSHKMHSYLSNLHSKYPDMGLITFGDNSAAEKAAIAWASEHNVHVQKETVDFKGTTDRTARTQLIQQRNINMLRENPNIRAIISCGKNNTIDHLTTVSAQITDRRAVAACGHTGLDANEQAYLSKHAQPVKTALSMHRQEQQNGKTLLTDRQRAYLETHKDSVQTLQTKHREYTTAVQTLRISVYDIDKMIDRSLNIQSVGSYVHAVANISSMLANEQDLKADLKNLAFTFNNAPFSGHRNNVFTQTHGVIDYQMDNSNAGLNTTHVIRTRENIDDMFHTARVNNNGTLQFATNTTFVHHLYNSLTKPIVGQDHVQTEHIKYSVFVGPALHPNSTAGIVQNIPQAIADPDKTYIGLPLDLPNGGQHFIKLSELPNFRPDPEIRYTGHHITVNTYLEDRGQALGADMQVNHAHRHEPLWQQMCGNAEVHTVASYCQAICNDISTQNDIRISLGMIEKETRFIVTPITQNDTIHYGNSTAHRSIDGAGQQVVSHINAITPPENNIALTANDKQHHTPTTDTPVNSGITIQHKTRDTEIEM